MVHVFSFSLVVWCCPTRDELAALHSLTAPFERAVVHRDRASGGLNGYGELNLEQHIEEGVRAVADRRDGTVGAGEGNCAVAGAMSVLGRKGRNARAGAT